MITRSEFLTFKQSEIAKKINEVCNIAKGMAIDNIILSRGEVADYARGSIEAYEEMLHLLNTGEGIYEKENDTDV